jgi:putative membrane protein
MWLVADNTAADAGAADSAARREPDYRFTFANERTFLAWQRTALGLLAAAVALVQLVPELTIPGARRVLGVGLAVLAILTSGMGLLRWQQADRAMRRNEPLPRHPSPTYLAVGLTLVAIIALGLVIAKAMLS